MISSISLSVLSILSSTFLISFAMSPKPFNSFCCSSKLACLFPILFCNSLICSCNLPLFSKRVFCSPSCSLRRFIFSYSFLLFLYFFSRVSNSFLNVCIFSFTCFIERTITFCFSFSSPVSALYFSILSFPVLSTRSRLNFSIRELLCRLSDLISFTTSSNASIPSILSMSGLLSLAFMVDKAFNSFCLANIDVKNDLKSIPSFFCTNLLTVSAPLAAMFPLTVAVAEAARFFPVISRTILY